jgi:hypothetical protein
MTVVVSSSGGELVDPSAEEVGLAVVSAEVVCCPSEVVVGPSWEVVPVGPSVEEEEASEVELGPSGVEDGVSEELTGQIVVETGTRTVVRTVEVALPGQFLTVSAQLMTVDTTEVSKMVDVVSSWLVGVSVVDGALVVSPAGLVVGLVSTGVVVSPAGLVVGLVSTGVVVDSTGVVERVMTGVVSGVVVGVETA